VRQSSTADVTLVVVGRKARVLSAPAVDDQRDMIGFCGPLAFSHATSSPTTSCSSTSPARSTRSSRLQRVQDPSSSARPCASSCCRSAAAETAAPARRDRLVHLRAESEGDPRRICCRVTCAPRCSARYGVAAVSMARDDGDEAASKNGGNDRRAQDPVHKARQEKITKELLDIVGGARPSARSGGMSTRKSFRSSEPRSSMWSSSRAGCGDLQRAHRPGRREQGHLLVLEKLTLEVAQHLGESQVRRSRWPRDPTA